MRGTMIRGAAAYPAHPDTISYMAGIGHAIYDLQRRKFMLDHPSEEPPPVVEPLGTDWLRDLMDLHLSGVGAASAFALYNAGEGFL